MMEKTPSKKYKNESTIKLIKTFLKPTLICLFLFNATKSDTSARYIIPSPIRSFFKNKFLQGINKFFVFAHDLAKPSAVSVLLF